MLNANLKTKFSIEVGDLTQPGAVRIAAPFPALLCESGIHGQSAADDATDGCPTRLLVIVRHKPASSHLALAGSFAQFPETNVAQNGASQRCSELRQIVLRNVGIHLQFVPKGFGHDAPAHDAAD